MKNKKYGNTMALKEHMLQGNKVSLIEALLLFGVQGFTAEITRLRNDGFIIKSQRVSMTKILKRINRYTKCQPPKNLPVIEIIMTEWWISR